LGEPSNNRYDGLVGVPEGSFKREKKRRIDAFASIQEDIFEICSRAKYCGMIALEKDYFDLWYAVECRKDKLHFLGETK